jgi:hypothetical protein
LIYFDFRNAATHGTAASCRCTGHWEEAEDVEVSRERLKVPKEYSSPIEAIAVPDDHFASQHSFT